MNIVTMSTCRIVNTVIVRIELGYIDIILLQYKLINLKEIAFLKGVSSEPNEPPWLRAWEPQH